MNKKTVLVDCGCLAHRAKHTTGIRLPKTGVIYGFFTQLLDSITTIGGFDNIAFCWDSKKSIRKKKVSTYKKRKHAEEITKFDEDCFKQFSLLKFKILPQLFNNNYVLSGYEADDIVASLLLTNVNGNKFISITQDEDFYQLLDYTDLYNPMKKSIVTVNKFKQLYGLNSPEQWVLVKSIGGCTSDNVKGASGVAEKTAIKFVKGECSRKIAKRIEEHMKTRKYRTDKWLVELPLAGTPAIPLKKYIPPKVEKFMSFLDRYRIRTFNLKNWITTFRME